MRQNHLRLEGENAKIVSALAQHTLNFILHILSVRVYVFKEKLGDGCNFSFDSESTQKSVKF